MNTPKFKVGDKVKVKNDENDVDNQSRLSDFECDLQMDYEDRTITARHHDAIWAAICDGKAFKITKVEEDCFNKGRWQYEASIGKYWAPFMFEEEDLEAV